MNATDLFDSQLLNWDLEVGPETREVLFAYASLLSRYDRSNVIGTRDFGRILTEHVLDSMSCLLFRPLREAGRLADVGSGGGLPGIPLAVSLPATRVELFEATGKKAEFLRHVVSELGLHNASVHNVRIEEAARREAHRATYDACTARAVARLSVVAEYCLPLTRVGGYVIAMKGRKDAREWDEGRRSAGALGGRMDKEVRVPLLPELDQKQRRLVTLLKVADTPQKYPRKTGQPARRPLGSTRGSG